MQFYKLFFLGLMASFSLSGTKLVAQKKPLKVAVVGMTHDHVHQILQNLKPEGIQVVAFAEPNKALAQRHFKSYKLPMSYWYESLEDLLKSQEIDAVFDFRSVKEHLSTVRQCAPRGIHIMVEKPLAYRLKDALEMQSLAKKHKIHLITNYETTWYPSHYKAFEMIHEEEAIGNIRKIVVHDGHKGPKEIGCSTEFLEWLTDPVANGGGAIIDFGCYGANLATWFMKSQRPKSVMAITQTHKPHIYPKVDDEATILLTYKKAQVVIQASWNWPYDRKDLEIYGENAALFADKELKLGYKDQKEEKVLPLQPLPIAFNNPFTYFSKVVHGTINPTGSLGSIENNLLVVEILEAALKSAKTGKRIYF